MSNLPSGFTEPREHDARCPYMCRHVRLNISDEERFLGCSDHEDHWCTCDELHEQDAEREAEAFVDWIASDASINASIADVLAGIRGRIRKKP